MKPVDDAQTCLAGGADDWLRERLMESDIIEGPLESLRPILDGPAEPWGTTDILLRQRYDKLFTAWAEAFMNGDDPNPFPPELVECAERVAAQIVLPVANENGV